jgi:hypothetical protein
MLKNMCAFLMEPAAMGFTMKKTKSPGKVSAFQGFLGLSRVAGYGMSCEGITERIEESESPSDEKAAMGRFVTILM